MRNCTHIVRCRCHTNYKLKIENGRQLSAIEVLLVPSVVKVQST